MDGQMTGKWTLYQGLSRTGSHWVHRALGSGAAKLLSFHTSGTGAWRHDGTRCRVQTWQTRGLNFGLWFQVSFSSDSAF